MDCRGVIFINKCHVNIINKQIEATDFVKILRRIPVGDDYNDLQGTIAPVSRVNKYDIHPTKKLSEFKTGSQKNNTNQKRMGDMSKMIFNKINRIGNQEELSRKDKEDLEILEIMQDILNTEF